MNWLRPVGASTFRVSILVARAGGERFEAMDALVDTGASYSWIPRDVLERLGVQSDEERLFVLADGSEVRYPIAWVRIALGERTQPTLAVFGDPGTEPILGAFTLEGFGLGVDPVNRRLIPVPGLLKSASLHISSSWFTQRVSFIAGSPWARPASICSTSSKTCAMPTPARSMKRS